MREINCVIIDHARFTETKITYGENGKITKKEVIRLSNSENKCKKAVYGGTILSCWLKNFFDFP